MSMIDDELAIERRRRIAEMLMQQGQQPLETDRMAGGYVIPVSPLAAVGKIVQQLSGAYIDRKADDREAKMKKERASLLSGMDFNAPDAPSKLANAGLTREAVELAMGRAKRSGLNSGTPGQWYVPPGAKEETFGGVKGFRLPDGSFIPSRAAMTEYQQAVTSPDSRAAVTAAIEGQKLHKFTDESGREGYGRGTDITGGAVPDLVPQSGVKIGKDAVWDGGSLENLSAEDAAIMDQVQPGWRNALGGQKQAPVMGPSMQDKAALDVKSTIQKKQATAEIENQQKVTQEQNARKQSAIKLQESLTSAYKYLYPEGKPLRDKSGRLIMPKEPTILSSSPADRLIMTGYENSFIDSPRAANLKGIRRYATDLVLGMTNGSLGTGFSNADRDFMMNRVGILEKAQNPIDVYNAVADMEERINKVIGVKSDNAEREKTQDGWSIEELP